MPPKTRKSQNGSVDTLAGFRLPPVYEWVECERDDINEGLTQPLRVRVLVNPSRAEIIALSQAMDEISDRSERRRKAAQAARKQAREDETDLPPLYDPEAIRQDDRDSFDLIADRITEWNVEALNEGGELGPLPPPAEAGGIVIELLPLMAQRYLLRLVQEAHLGGEHRSKLSRRPATTASGEAAKTPSGPQIVDIPTTATHQHRQTN